MQVNSWGRRFRVISGAEAGIFLTFLVLQLARLRWARRSGPTTGRLERGTLHSFDHSKPRLAVDAFAANILDGTCHPAVRQPEMNTSFLLDQAIQHHLSGSLAQAEGLYLQVLQADPSCAEAWCYLGVIQVQQGGLDAAAVSLQKALQLRPHFPEAHCNLGTLFLFQGKFECAIECYESALRFQPNLADAHLNLGKAYHELRRYPEAEASSRRAPELSPAHAGAWANLGSALQCLGRLDEALACCQRAVNCEPQSPEAHLNLGNAFLVMGKMPEAVAAFDHALRLRPGFPDAHLGRSLALLLAGDFERGWEEYEWRWQTEKVAKRYFEQPPWDGSPLDGRTILLHAEQGLGDTLQFIRYAPLVRQCGGQVIVECQKALVTLLSRSPGFDQLIGYGSALPHFDVHLPLMSLPRVFRTTLETVPNSVPYIFPDPDLVVRWRKQLSGLQGLKIGVAWQGRPDSIGGYRRAIPLKCFVPLAHVAGVHLISLQKGFGREQIDDLPDDFPIVNLGSPLDENGAFADTAAIMKVLDLVVTADTAIPHLAGALGVPVWLALSTGPAFHWLLARDDSPWYPTMRLFREREMGNFVEVFERMAEQLRDRLEGTQR